MLNCFVWLLILSSIPLNLVYSYTLGMATMVHKCTWKSSTFPTLVWTRSGSEGNSQPTWWDTLKCDTNVSFLVKYSG
jgi:hypothetical protein